MRKFFGALYLFYGLIIFFSTMILVLPFIILFSFLPGRVGGSLPFFFLRIWAQLFSTLSFFHYIVRDSYRVDKNRTYIYVSNHNSYLDSPGVVIAAPNAFKPLGKIEMSKIPGFGFIYKRVVVMIDRSSKESRSESVEKLKEVLKSGISILIFPEGSMNTTDKPVNDFYDGAFRIAIETQTPIAPFVMINARKLLPRKKPLQIKPGVMQVIFADPVEVNAYGPDDLEILKDKVHKIMSDLIVQHQK